MYYREDEIQMTCVNHFRYRYTRYFRLLFHPQNEGNGDRKKGARMKAMGVQAGAPDLMLLVPRNGYHGLGIEMKTEKGRQSDSQKDYQKLMEEQGYKYAVCRSLEEFMDVCHDYLGPEEDPNADALRRIMQFDNE